MAETKSKSDGATSENTNANNININIEQPKRKAKRSTPKPKEVVKPKDSYMKVIVGGIILLLLTLYYIQNGKSGKSARNPENLPRTNQIR